MGKDDLTWKLGCYSGLAIFWFMPVARIMALSLAYDIASRASGNAENIQLILWALWVVISTGFAFYGQPVRNLWVRLFWWVDVLLAALMILIDPGSGGAMFAFVVCVGASASSRFEHPAYLIASLAIPSVALSIGDEVISFWFADRQSLMPGWHPGISFSLVMIAVWLAALAAIRRSQFDKFRDDCAGLKSRLSGHKIEGDLQEWVESLAQLYSPNKACFAFSLPFGANAMQVINQDLEVRGRPGEAQTVLSALQSLTDENRVIDCERNQCFLPATRHIRALTDDEQLLAKFLNRSGVNVAIVQKLQVDKLVGGIICAVDVNPHPALLAESSLLGGLFVETANYLDHKAKAERDFISDAHDVARRDLHDGVLQTLAALRMRLSTMAKRQEIAKMPLALDLRKTVSIITLEQTRLRGLLETSAREEKMVNLVTRLDVCLRSISLQWDISVKLLSEEPGVPVDPESALNIENLLREVVANAVRHTGSRSLTVALSLNHDALMLVVKDLSASDETAISKARSSLPLKSASLRQRLQMVNGEAYVVGLEQSDLLAIRIPMEQIDDA